MCEREENLSVAPRQRTISVVEAENGYAISVWRDDASIGRGYVERTAGDALSRVASLLGGNASNASNAGGVMQRAAQARAAFPGEQQPIDRSKDIAASEDSPGDPAGEIYGLMTRVFRKDGPFDRLTQRFM